MSRASDKLGDLLQEAEFNPVDGLTAGGMQIAFVADEAAHSLFDRLTSELEPDEVERDEAYYESWGETWERLRALLEERYLFGFPGGEVWLFDEPHWQFHFLIHVQRAEIIDAAFFETLAAAIKTVGDSNTVFTLLIDHPDKEGGFNMYAVEGVAFCPAAEAGFLRERLAANGEPRKRSLFQVVMRDDIEAAGGRSGMARM